MCECVYVGIPYHWGGGEPGYCIIYVCMNAAYVYRYMHIYIYIYNGHHPPLEPPNIRFRRWPFMIGIGTVFAVVTKHCKIQCFLLCLPSNTSIHLDKSTKYDLEVKGKFRPQIYIASQHLQKRPIKTSKKIRKPEK